MKKQYLALLFACLLLLSACQKADTPPEGYYKAASSTEINGDEKLISVIAELLPDFTVKEQSGGYILYEDVSPGTLRKYVDELCDAGFSCEEAMFRYLLYRDDLILFITNNTENYGECSISGYEQRKTEDGLTAQEAMTFAEDHIFFLMERSDSELYQQTGMQCFIAPVDIQKQWPESYGTDAVNKGYTPILYYVGPAGGICLDNCVGCDATYADLNENGIQEIVTWGYGPTSGVFSFYIYGIELQEGKPVLAYSELFSGPHAPIKLRRDENGQVWLDREEYISTPAESVAVTLQDGKVALIKADDNPSATYASP